MATLITDPRLIEQFNSGAFLAKQDQEEPQSPYVEEGSPKEEVGILEDIGAGISSGVDRMQASGFAVSDAISRLAGDEEGSRYSQRKLRSNLEEAKEVEKNLGVAGTIANAATGMVVPVATAVATGGASLPAQIAAQTAIGGLQEYGDIKVRGVEEGVWDATLGRFVPKGSRLPTRIASAATQDALSGVGHQVASNLAVGEEWDKDAHVAAIGGVVAGGGIRGLNNLFNITLNKGGERAAGDLSSIKKTTGGQDINSNFQNDVMEYSNFNEDNVEKITTSSNFKEIRERVDAKINFDIQHGGNTAALKGAQLLKSHNVPITPALFKNKVSNFDGSNSTVFGEDLGYSWDKMEQSSRDIENATTTTFRDINAQNAAETSASIKNATQKQGREAMAKGLGAFHQNARMFEDMIIKGEVEEGIDVGKLRLLQTALSTLDKDMQKYKNTNHIEIGQPFIAAAKRAYEDASELGVIHLLQGVDGTPGTFNPILDAQTLKYMHDMLTSQFDSFNFGAPTLAPCC